MKTIVVGRITKQEDNKTEEITVTVAGETEKDSPEEVASAYNLAVEKLEEE